MKPIPTPAPASKRIEEEARRDTERAIEIGRQQRAFFDGLMGQMFGSTIAKAEGRA